MVKRLFIYSGVDAINVISIYLDNNLWRTELLREKGFTNLYNIPVGTYYFTDYYVLPKGKEFIVHARKSSDYRLTENYEYDFNITGAPISPFRMYKEPLKLMY